MNTYVSVSIEALVSANELIVQFSNDVDGYVRKTANDITSIIMNCNNKINRVEDELSQIKQDIDRSNNDLVNIEFQIKETEILMERMSGQIEGARNRIASCERELSEKKNSIAAAYNEANRVQNMAAVSQDPYQQENLYRQASSIRGRCSLLEADCRGIESAKEACCQTIQSLETSRNELLYKAEEYAKKKEDIKRRIEELEDREKTTDDRLFRLNQAFMLFSSDADILEEALNMYRNKCMDIASRSNEAIAECVKYIGKYEDTELC